MVGRNERRLLSTRHPRGAEIDDSEDHLTRKRDFADDEDRKNQSFEWSTMAEDDESITPRHCPSGISEKFRCSVGPWQMWQKCPSFRLCNRTSARLSRSPRERFDKVVRDTTATNFFQLFPPLHFQDDCLGPVPSFTVDCEAEQLRL